MTAKKEPRLTVEINNQIIDNAHRSSQPMVWYNEAHGITEEMITYLKSLPDEQKKRFLEGEWK